VRDDDHAHVLRDAAAAAARAPSAQNSQPWRFRIAGTKLEILADYRRHLTAIDPEARQLVISCGCALFNARVAVRAWGYGDVVTLNIADERSELLATLELGDRIVTTEVDLALLRAIGKRVTNRGPFLDRPVSMALASELAETASIHGATLVRLDPTRKEKLAELVELADRLQFSDPAFRDELARWLTGFASRRRDGIPFASKEYGSAMPFTLRRTLGSPELGERFGHLEHQLVQDAPLALVLGTASDEPLEWLRFGQALEAVLLHATHLGLSAAFVNQLIELPELRGAVATLSEIPRPQIALRVGFAAEPVRQLAPRRELAEVLA
jgi:nitroreductase